MKCEHGKDVWIVKKRTGEEWLVGDMLWKQRDKCERVHCLYCSQYEKLLRKKEI